MQTLGNIIVALLDNPIGGYTAWAILTGAVAVWVYKGGEPPQPA